MTTQTTRTCTTSLTWPDGYINLLSLFTISSPHWSSHRLNRQKAKVSTMVSTKVIRLANPPNRGAVDDSTFRLDTVDLPELKDGQLLVKVLALGNEPAQKTWMDTEIDPKRLYMPPIKKDEVVRAPGIVEVVESKSGKYERGQRLVGFPGWREYAVWDEKDVQEPAA